MPGSRNAEAAFHRAGHAQSGKIRADVHAQQSDRVAGGAAIALSPRCKGNGNLCRCQPGEPCGACNGIEGKEGKKSKVEGGTFEQKTEKGGVGTTWKRGIREYVSSGYTRRNPDGTIEVDNDFKGKWKDREYTIIEGTLQGPNNEGSVAKGSFGSADTFFAGSGSAFKGGYDTSAKAGITTKGVETSAKAVAEGSLLEGKVTAGKGHVVDGALEGKVGSAKAEAKAEVILTAEQATLGGALGAEAHLAEVKASGEVCLTPTRISRTYVGISNWLTGGKKTAISDDWDWGICLNGEASLSLGAQAKAEADAGYKKGKLRAEAGAKLGLGVGAGVKVGGGLTGLDKAWGQLKNWWNN